MARKTKEAAQETRHAILDAAERVFQENGVSRTSMAEIASSAGVTRGAVYWHFKNKADLFNAMIQRIFAPLEATLEISIAQELGNPLVALRDFAVYFLGRVVADTRYRRVLEIFWHKCEYVGEMAALRDTYLECGSRYLSINEEGIRLAQKRGFLSPSLDPRMAAVGLMAILDGLVVNWTRDSRLFPLADVGSRIVDTYFSGLCTTR